MNRLELKSHAIIMTVGPSNCGKTFFCENHLIPFLETQLLAHKYFSSDAIRRELLHAKAHKYDKKMMVVSKQAFATMEIRSCRSIYSVIPC